MRWILIALLAGCTTSNPKFEKGDLLGATPGDGSIEQTDAATHTTDGALAMQCTSGPRTCGSMGSEVCTDGAYVADRTCPQASMCTGGYCAEPQGARTCTTAVGTSDSLCEMGLGGGSANNLACEPFVQSGALVWACAKPVGMGTDATACTSGNACRSGVCASNGKCLRACATNTDCGNLTCADLSITVEGVVAMVRGCSSST